MGHRAQERAEAPREGRLPARTPGTFDPGVVLAALVVHFVLSVVFVVLALFINNLSAGAAAVVYGALWPATGAIGRPAR